MVLIGFDRFDKALIGVDMVLIGFDMILISVDRF